MGEIGFFFFQKDQVARALLPAIFKLEPCLEAQDY